MAMDSPSPSTAATVLGIDLGTSSVKAVLIDPSGHVVAQASKAYAVTSPHPGWSETDPYDWLAATAAAVRLALAQVESAPVAIGLAGQMHGLVATDGAGRPVRPAMLWSDARAVDQLGTYRALPDGVRARLANPLSPGMAGPMLGWLARVEPQTFARMRWALQPKDWLRAQLTGGFHTEPSDASATLLYDVRRDSWDATVLEALGIPAGVLPDILGSSAAVAGRLRADGAARLGVPAGITVAVGAADTAAAALGSGLFGTDTVQLTIGTGAQLIKPVDGLPEPLPSDPVTHLYRSATETGWYGMGAILNGGLTLAWVCRVLGADWQELYAAAAADPRLDAPYFLPHLNGERTPYLDPDLRGAWTNLGPRHERTDLLRAALEGVAFAVRDALEHVLTASDALDHLRLAGGGTAEPAWRQLLADVLEHDLAPVEVPAASGLGAALLGSLAADLTDEPTLRSGKSRPSRVTTQPRGEYQALYRERYAAFIEKVSALRGATARPACDAAATPSPWRRP